MKSPKDYVLDEIGEDNYPAFINWAFGENFNENTPLDEIVPLWNAQHPNIPFTKLTLDEVAEMVYNFRRFHETTADLP